MFTEEFIKYNTKCPLSFRKLVSQQIYLNGLDKIWRKVNPQKTKYHQPHETTKYTLSEMSMILETQEEVRSCGLSIDILKWIQGYLHVSQLVQLKYPSVFNMITPKHKT